MNKFVVRRFQGCVRNINGRYDVRAEPPEIILCRLFGFFGVVSSNVDQFMGESVLSLHTTDVGGISARDDMNEVSCVE